MAAHKTVNIAGNIRRGEGAKREAIVILFALEKEKILCGERVDMESKLFVYWGKLAALLFACVANCFRSCEEKRNREEF